ncbi:TIGR03986 family CRISPR-associated RAMP protein [Aliarcobacter skirrowii]|uniref:CRISPR/Cas system-associated RAMP protein n=1 Tax=Aliarcobacter skirrowii CCUG 10374 TaxID=1032239 RepID=A0AAD0SL29_9BACT|nr:TIGR03986 family CRISPR-associated RAMP protein [Aliarcobacter skirrowii]AXX84697.1 CRISPR/Cas system-associated RAMP protein [Aliarcobacter skirrowii CCUG 10374]KAB0620241.1 TIGR03986 family CRISPR-associated RAMP protein [Aliarcobacter skirrowii CCUG 10374]RXI25424.1 TIGR03986 family CRISPR-associated RAMP protein [Aliarcobacter skirrowii CCUG 10374]SUV14868.1 CRISPR-associated protein [Aliarcobacter skirrowii]
MITAPYNFVPLNKEIFYPSWADDVSHDVPFKDGESGEIDITITAKSPIFIRNHSKDKEKPTDEFCHHINQNGAKEFYIPSSSIKGMVRNVLEILSFSKITINENYKDIFGVRDMSNQKELVGGANGCGFLIKKDDEFYIEDCGQILTISHTNLEEKFKNLKKLESAKEKYNKFGLLKELKFSTYKKIMDIRGRKIPKNMAKFDNNSSLFGKLVFTGNIGNKKHEFIFKTNGKILELDKKVFNNFSNVYFKDENSVDGQFWKQNFPKTLKIPVFYIKDKDSNKIKHIGLTQLFKIAYNKSIFEASKQNIKENKLDLAQTIFGYVSKEKALKGRVQFSHFKSTIQRYEKEVEQVLGTPNPTYYPNYIRQTNTNRDKVNKYITLMDSNAQISGWKRYPLHSSIKNPPLIKKKDGSINHDITTHFKPLSKDTVFKGKLRFHNLKKIEIGALLSAITFHGQSDKYMHNIGMAKSLGYGKIDIKLEPRNLKYTQNEYLKEFENEISKHIPNWRNSEQLKELFAMANRDINIDKNKNLVYQLLENPKPKYKDKNDFTGAKKDKDYLLPYSGIIPNNANKAKQEPNRGDNKMNGIRIVSKVNKK